MHMQQCKLSDAQLSIKPDLHRHVMNHEPRLTDSCATSLNSHQTSLHVIVTFSQETDDSTWLTFDSTKSRPKC